MAKGNVGIHQEIQSAAPVAPTENTSFIPTGQTGLPQQLLGCPENSASGAARAVSTQRVPFTKLWIYPATESNSEAGGNNAGVLTVGLSFNVQPDAVFPTYKDPSTATVVGGLPWIYEAPLGQSLDLRSIYINGAAGDGVFFRYL